MCERLRGWREALGLRIEVQVADGDGQYKIATEPYYRHALSGVQGRHNDIETVKAGEAGEAHVYCSQYNKHKLYRR